MFPEIVLWADIRTKTTKATKSSSICFLQISLLGHCCLFRPLGARDFASRAP